MRTALRAALVVLALGAACNTTQDDQPEAGASGAGGSGGRGVGGTGGVGDASSGGAAGTSGAAGSGASDAGLDAPSDGTSDASDASDAADAPLDVGEGGPCHAYEHAEFVSTAAHVANCSPLTFTSHPPSGGPHYGTWAHFGEYDWPLPPGFWVHDLEHGAIVLLYDCPAGCDAEVTAARAFMAGLPVDPLCPEGGDVQRRVLLVPFAGLGSRWGGAAWGFTFHAECFDPVAFHAFYDAHYGLGTEATCADGFRFGAGDGGSPLGCEDAGLPIP